MSKKVVIQRMGQTMKEGTIVSWLKQEGDRVNKGDYLYDLEYDKASTEVESPADGILHILVEAGQTLPVGTKVAEIYEDDEDFSFFDNPKNNKKETEELFEEDTVILPKGEECKYGISASAKRLIRQRGIDALHIIPQNGRRIMAEDVNRYIEAHSNNGNIDSSSVKSSPLAAKVAEKIGVDLGELQLNRRVLAQDIMDYVQNRSLGESVESTEVLPMSAMRRAISRNMQNSHMTSPTVTYNIRVDMSEMKKFRSQLKKQDVNVSFTDILVKYVAGALKDFPLLNCSVDGENIIRKKHINIGVAVALENGLVVPNIADADQKSLMEISEEIKSLAKNAREGNLNADRLHGGTFTITNLGMFGIEGFSPIINQPEVGILGVNAIVDTPVALDGVVQIRPIMLLSLTADHRVVDGAVAAQFLQRIKTMLENPLMLLA